jgi:hypothetical protein
MCASKRTCAACFIASQIFLEQVVQRVASTRIMGGSVRSSVYSALQTSRNRVYIDMNDGHCLTSHCYFWSQVGTNLRRASKRVATGRKVVRVHIWCNIAVMATDRQDERKRQSNVTTYNARRGVSAPRFQFHDYPHGVESFLRS